MAVSPTGDGWKNRKSTFARGQFCPGPILTAYGGSSSHTETFPALIFSCLPRQIPWLFKTLNFTTRDFWRRSASRIWKEIFLQLRLQSLRCSPIPILGKGINLVTPQLTQFLSRASNAFTIIFSVFFSPWPQERTGVKHWEHQECEWTGPWLQMTVAAECLFVDSWEVAVSARESKKSQHSCSYTLWQKSF